MAAGLSEGGVGTSLTPRSRFLQKLKKLLWGSAQPRRDLLECSILGRRTLNGSSRTTVLQTDLEFVRCCIALLLSLALYTNIKVGLPFFQQVPWDSFFLNLDHAIFGPQLAKNVEHWFASRPEVSNYLWHMYAHYYVWMVVLAFILYVRRDTIGIRWLLVSVAATYLIAIQISLLYPSLRAGLRPSRRPAGRSRAGARPEVGRPPRG